MYQGRRDDVWDHTAYLAATMLNCRWGVKRMVKPAELHPFRRVKEKPMKVPLKALRGVLMRAFAIKTKDDHGPSHNQRRQSHEGVR